MRKTKPKSKPRAKLPRKPQEVRNLVIVSDMHMICRLGLYPTDFELRLDGGGFYKGSEAQAVVWSWWQEFWDEFIPTATRGEPYSVVVNGDSIDGGAHHKNTTHISANLGDQERLALHVLRPVRDRAVRFHMIRGTEVHSGASGVDEERLAARLGAEPYGDLSTSYRLRLRLGDSLVDISHHIGTTGTMAAEPVAIHKEIEQAFVEAARWGEEIPDVVVRSHRHRYAETRVFVEKHGKSLFGTSCTTPGWQLKTPFVYRIAGGRAQRPQFGGILVRAGDEETYTRVFAKSVETAEIKPA
jgi:hypothetical protein